MKKIIIGLMGLSLFTVFAVLVLASPSNILYFLNWGEYIDMSLVQRFEQEKNCQVILETVTSSEAMYQKIVPANVRAFVDMKVESQKPKKKVRDAPASAVGGGL